MNSVPEHRFLQKLEANYGTLVGGDALRKELGYRTKRAFRRAVERRALPLPVFKIPRRRGVFAFTSDLANWFAKLQTRQLHTPEKEVIPDG